MGVTLAELIERTQDGIRSFEHSSSTVYQYQMSWKALSDYFVQHDQVQFSRQLAEQYILESKARLEAGVIKRWRYKLDRRAVRMLIACFEDGHVVWKYYEDPPAYLHQSAYHRLHTDYLNYLRSEGKSLSTVQTYGIVARQFLEYLEQRDLQSIAEAGVNEISSFIPFVAKQYQPASMRTVLSALRCFLRYAEVMRLTPGRLSSVVPASRGKTTRIVPLLTPQEEQALLDATERRTASGKRNYAMLLLALRLGLRSSDIINLKRGDIHWNHETIEIVQEKTGTRLVLPLLAEVGNAIADYILNGRPASGLPYVFLRSQAPYQRMSGHANCYGISRKLMHQAGIRQAPGERKGFHCLRHTVAARLLAVGAPLSTISSILGHQNKNSTRPYLSTDQEHLRAAALGLAGIEIMRG